MDKELELKDIKGFIRRRKKTFYTTLILLFIVGFCVAIILPPVYQSQATIRIEGQQIPKDYIKSTISTGFVEEHIEKISQKVLNRSNLRKITDRFNLYADKEEKENEFDKVSQLRKDITIQNISAEIKSPTSGRARSVTIAFTLSYEGRKPKTVKSVTNTLSKLFLEEDVKTREQLASITSDFLGNELERLKNQIHTYEKKISEFKKKHIGELPSDSDVNLLTVNRLERELDKRDNQLRLLNEKRIILKSQLASVQPIAPIMVDGEQIASSPEEQLKKARLELTNLQNKLSDKHPDIKRLKREVQKLESQIKNNGSNKASGAKAPQNTLPQKPDNPVYINLTAQINSIDMEIKTLQEDKIKLNGEIAKYQGRIQNTPNVEKQLNELTRDYGTAEAKYKDIYNKLMEAKVAKEMEDKKRGQRFQIVSQAYLPKEPYKPNRLLIIIISLLLSTGAGSVVAFLREGVDDSVKTSEQVKILTGLPVLSSLSYIVTSQEKRARRLKKMGWAFIVICFLGAVLYFVDGYVIKLAELWTFILDRLMMIA